MYIQARINRNFPEQDNLRGYSTLSKITVPFAQNSTSISLSSRAQLHHQGSFDLSWNRKFVNRNEVLCPDRKKPFHLTRKVSGISNRKFWWNEKRARFPALFTGCTFLLHLRLVNTCFRSIWLARSIFPLLWVVWGCFHAKTGLNLCEFHTGMTCLHEGMRFSIRVYMKGLPSWFGYRRLRMRYPFQTSGRVISCLNEQLYRVCMTSEWVFVPEWKPRSGTVTGVNSHRYDPLPYEILCWYHVNEYRATRGNRSEPVPEWKSRR